MSNPVQSVTDEALHQLQEFAAAAEQVAIGVSRADLSAKVPACPKWTTYDLVTHLGNVHAWAATVVETGKAAPDLEDAPRRRPKALALWYAAKAEDLYEVLRAADPERPCWNFAFGDQGLTGFWHRRQVHETIVHGLDLRQANPKLGTRGIPQQLAGDGIDELLTVFLRRMHARGYPAALEHPVVVEATDLGRSWTVRLGTTLSEGFPIVEAGGAEGADRLRGVAAELYPLLWKRTSLHLTGVELIGDQQRLTAFLGSRLSA